MRKLALLLLILPLSIFIYFVYLVRTDKLPNPIEDVETDNVVLSFVLGKVSDLLGFVPEENIEKEKSIEEKFAESGYPTELFSFDVTSQPAVFSIVSVDSTQKMMLLRYLLPFELYGVEVDSEIKCSSKDSVVTTFNSATQESETVTADRPLYEIAEAEKDTLQGICGDLGCSAIIGKCELIK